MKITLEIHNKMIQMHDNGMSCDEIGKLLNVSGSAVADHVSGRIIPGVRKMDPIDIAWFEMEWARIYPGNEERMRKKNADDKYRNRKRI